MQIHTQLCLDHLTSILDKGLGGLIAEFGICGANTSVELAKLLKKYNRKLTAFDCFMGLPYDEECLKQGEMKVPRKQVEEILQLNDVSNVDIVEGLIENTLQSFENHQFAFTFLDLDLYASTKFASDFVAPRTILNGIIAFHDYKFHRTPGIRIVVDELLKTKKFAQTHLSYNTIFLTRVA
jgi:hypothetical protein